MKEILNKIIASFDNHSKGFSARKLSGFIIICLIVAAHIGWFRYATKHENWQQLELVLTIDYSALFSLLGLTTWQSMKQKPNDESGGSGEKV